MEDNIIIDTEASDALTIIDGDVLEDTFEYIGSIYDRFTHVLICNSDGIVVQPVLYTYARNFNLVRKNINIVSVELYPYYSEYANRNQLLQILSDNPQVLCSLIARQDAILPNLHQELRELKELKILDDYSAKLLSDRLINFLKSIKVGNYKGEGTFWLPENYQGEEEKNFREEDEDYEDYIRRIICKHIKRRRLPMAHIIPISNERLVIMNELIDILSNYNYIDDIYNAMAKSHFVSIMKNKYHIITPAALKTLMTEEFRCVKNEQLIDCNSIFIFNEDHLEMVNGTVHKWTVSNEEAHERIHYYVGNYLDDLDLSKSYVTGSAITASLMRTNIDDEIESWADRIDILYPKVLTELETSIHNSLREENIGLWNIYAISENEGIMTKDGKSHRFTIKPGADVDIAIDNTVSDEEYRIIAQGHFEVIQRYYSYVKMREYVKPKGDWNYLIYTDDPRYVPVFRNVEIYRSSFRNICSHHVGAVRGCFTSRWSEQPTEHVNGSYSEKQKFYVTASALWTSRFRTTPNYHYFAGRKSNPQDIIIKNLQRGISLSAGFLLDFITNYKEHKGIKLSCYPFYIGEGVTYSIFAASLEFNKVKEISARKERRRQKKAAREYVRQIICLVNSRFKLGTDIYE